MTDMFFRPGLRALVLAAHTDDEFGCAGTMARLLRSGAQMRYVALSSCEASVPEHLPKDILATECRSCMECLGLSKDSVEIWDFPVRHFPQYRQDILERFVKLARSYKPELILLPTSSDTHQDHATVYAEGFRAFKNATLLGYELPQNLISFRNSAFIGLTEEDLQAKISALSSYASQQFRKYSTADFIRSLATVRGVQNNMPLAEAFEVIRLTIV
jgi:N-acetylglucosamine malate deacetylase 1